MKEIFLGVEYEVRGARRFARRRNFGRQAAIELVVRLTEKEDAALVRLAKAAGQTESEYARCCIAANKRRR